VDTVAHPPIRSRAAGEAARQISWLDLLLPLALMAVCFFAGLSAIGLTGPDEPRYAAIARAMARTGDWITPRLLGQPWFEKPALYYWLAGAAFRIFGEGEFAMRLPSVLAAVLATIAAAWAALRAYGLDAARLVLIMLAVTVGLVSFSHAAAADMLFAALLAATAAVAAEMLQKKRAGMFAKIMFGFLLGAATLAKGPAAVLLAGGAILLWALASRQITAAFRFFHPLCLAAFAIVAVPWYALCAARNPDFVRVFFIEHNIQRYLTPLFQHPQPFWFFGPVLLAAIFPWTPLVLPLVLDAARARHSAEWRDSPSLFFAAWVIAPLLFFSFSESKLPGYILPAVPPLVLLLAATLSRRLSPGDASSRTWPALVALSLPLLSLLAGYGFRQLPAGSGLATPRAWLPLLVLAIAGGAACALLAWMKRRRAAIAGVAVLMAALAAGVAIGALPKLDPYLSAREAARSTQQQAQSTDYISILGTDRSLQFGLEYYLDRPLPEWTAAAPKPAWVWATPSRAADLERFPGLRCTIVHKLTPEAWLVRIDPLANR
jgi:4-amino-4-deoxy-L-arabinose transferase-like glycosyltransferase